MVLFQSCAIWTAEFMADAKKIPVSVKMDGVARVAAQWLACPAARNTAIARTAPVAVRRDGMAPIVSWVSSG